MAALERFPVRCGLFFILGLAVFLPSLNGEFIMDDWGYITQNPIITQSSSPLVFWISFKANDYWPLTYTCYWVLYRLFGEHPVGYHVVNVALHALNAALLFNLAGVFQIGSRARWFLSLLFLLHPLNVQAVSWIVQFKTLLSTTFALLTLFLFHTRNWGGLISYALSLFAKTSTVTLPAVLFMWRRDWKKVAPYFVLSVIGGALTLWNNEINFIDRDAYVFHMPWYERPLMMAQNLLFYISSFFVPFPLAYMYPFSLPTLASAKAWLSLGALALIFKVVWRNPALRSSGFFFLSYLFLILPSLGLVSIPNMKLSLVADHWAYLPNTFLLLGLGKAAQSLPRKNWVSAGAVTILIVSFWLSFFHAANFASEEAFWLRSAALNPGAAAPHYNLGTVYGKQQREREAIHQYDLAISFDSQHARAWYNKGRSHFLLGEVADARECFLRAVEINPRLAVGYVGLSKIAERLLQPQEALHFVEEGLKQNPGDAELEERRRQLTNSAPDGP